MQVNASSGTTWRVGTGAGAQTTAVHEPATASRRGVLFVCAHGAGGHMSDRSVLAVTAVLRARGIDVVRFNFPYREAHAGRPDPMPVLKACIEAVAAHARREVDAGKVLLGGRSMGGRAASMLAADGCACDGLLLLAYPLHPAGQPDKLRDAHLGRIRVPVLCCNGTRDPLCRHDLMERTLEGLGDGWTMRWLEAADHSFHVAKASGRTDPEVLDEVGDATLDWLAACVEPGRIAASRLAPAG